MKEDRLTGHNVIQLIYPLRRNNVQTSICDNLENNPEWEKILSSEIQNNDQHNNNIKYIFPENYSVDEVDQDGGTNRKWMESKYFYSYFHPSIQKNLFHANANLSVFRNKKSSSKIYQGYFYQGGQAEATEPIQFEWISSEIYVFSEDTAYLIVRLSLNENIQVDANGEQIFNHPIQKLNIWMKFLNRVRQNYKKFDGQEWLVVQKKGYANTLLNYNNFFYYVDEFVNGSSLNLVISSLSRRENLTGSDIYKYVEPNAYAHAFVQTDMSTQELTDEELYQIIYIDDVEGQSGKSNQEFLNTHLYKRWAPYTYYTSIDYGSVTIASASNYCYKGSSVKKYGFGDVMYQHHTKHYLFLVLLQYYYRDQLQEILVQYSNLTELTTKVKEEGKMVLENYYNLNQHFFFDRVTNEIQGMELWDFYQRIMGVKVLHASVRADMQELNQRIIEKIGEKQNDDIQTLTVIAALTGMLGMNLIIPRADDDNIFSFLLNFQWIKNGVPIVTTIMNIITIFIIVWVLNKGISHISSKLKSWWKKKRKFKLNFWKS
ncbi:hypothetical protein [Bacillus cereus]|uniref:hypothetical protein n=1 Tax=Bacillus cereus TaxID=1396 RepID=UPI000C289FC0|nr:hypothetical protein [Bacillus cereus]MCU5040550.1 hypothetical protein [Bacillus cereus]